MTSEGALALELRALSVVSAEGDGSAILDGVSLSIPRGGSLGLVGHSGAGKSSLGLAILGLLSDSLRVTVESSIRLGGQELLTADGAAQRAARGRAMTMVFQEPATALDPSMSIGAQIAESLHAVEPDRAARDRRAIAWLTKVGFSDAPEAAQRYPHELSGGLRQRVLLAMAMAPEPLLLIADEPTTALDATLQAQLLDLLETLRATTGSALLLISHDLALVAERCARTALLEHGRLVEEGASQGIWHAHHARRPRDVAVRGPADAGTSGGSPLVAIRDLRISYSASGHWLARSAPRTRAVVGLSLDIDRGECVGLIGESGAGKSSLARALVGLTTPDEGTIQFDGRPLDHRDRRTAARRIQWIPQDAGASLTPTRTIGAMLAELLDQHRIVPSSGIADRVATLLREVGLDPSWVTRRPPTLSTGERQRVAIARALAVEPALLVCDEPVASLDAERREQLLSLLASIQHRRQLSLLLISHDLRAVERLASRVAVMYRGRIVEIGPADAILRAPRMPYTQRMRAAVPTGEPLTPERRHAIRGALTAPAAIVEGCEFESRCGHPAKDALCRSQPPALALVAPKHQVACWKVASGD